MSVSVRTDLGVVDHIEDDLEDARDVGHKHARQPAAELLQDENRRIALELVARGAWVGDRGGGGRRG